MKLSAFVNKLKEEVHERGYKLNELDLTRLETKYDHHLVPFLKISLIDKNEDEITIIIDTL